MNKACFFILCSISCIANSYAQVYKKPGGKAEATVESSYKKLVIPAGYQSFYDKIKKIDSVSKNSYHENKNDCIMFYHKGFAFLYLPSYNYNKHIAIDISVKPVTNEDNITFYPHPSFDLLATNGNVNPAGDFIKNEPYNDVQSSLINKNNEAFLDNINKSISNTSLFNVDMQLPFFVYTNFTVECIYNRKFRNEGNAYPGNRFSDIIAMMEKKAIKKNDLISLKDLAIVYAAGLDLTNPDPIFQNISFGKINKDNEKSLMYVDALEKLSGTSQYSDVYSFTCKMVKAYDLLQIGTQQKDAAKIKQAADLYTGLWNIAANDAQWNTLFEHIHQHVSEYRNEEDMKNAQYTGGGHPGNDYLIMFETNRDSRKIDPYFLQAIKVQLLVLLLKSCYQVQVLSPGTMLSNNATPADFAAGAYKAFIDNFNPDLVTSN